MALYISDGNANLTKFAGNKSVDNRAMVDASNLSSANVTSWKQKLEIGLIASGSLSSSSSTLTITKTLEDGVYDLYFNGTTSTGLDLKLKPNNISKSTWATIWQSYGSSAPTGYHRYSADDFFMGTFGTDYSIAHYTIEISNGTVIIDMNNISYAGNNYRRTGLAYGYGYGTINSLVFTTSTGTLNSGFEYRLYRRG